MTDRTGSQAGNYHLEHFLGHGAFADVYLGRHIHLGTPAAIKILHTHLQGERVDAFLREAKLVAHLEHPHIIRVLDFDVLNNIPFLVMSYAPGGTIRQRHPKGSALPLKQVVAYVQQLATALQYAHDENIVHRDVKPENILLGRRGELLLSDFGIATFTRDMLQDSPTFSEKTQIAGTIAYMAPEQLQNQVVPASDQYALAVLTYEWIAGERPFQGTYAELIEKHLQAEPTPLRTYAPTLPAEVEQVILTALAKDPDGRYPCVAHFATALTRNCETYASKLAIWEKRHSVVSTALNQSTTIANSLAPATPKPDWLTVQANQPALLLSGTSQEPSAITIAMHKGEEATQLHVTPQKRNDAAFTKSENLQRATPSQGEAEESIRTTQVPVQAALPSRVHLSYQQRRMMVLATILLSVLLIGSLGGALVFMNHNPSKLATHSANPKREQPTSTPVSSPNIEPTHAVAITTPTAKNTSSPTPTSAPTVAATNSQSFTFETSSDQWLTRGHVVNIQSSTMVAHSGTHSLQVVFFSQNQHDLPFIFVRVAPAVAPLVQQTISAWVYVPANSNHNVQGQIYVQDSVFAWHISGLVILQTGWNRLQYSTPSLSGSANQVGLQFVTSPYNSNTTIYIDDVEWSY